MPGSAESASITYRDRLLIEATRALERDAGPINDGDAVQAALALDGDFETRLARRAKLLPHAESLREELGHLSVIIGWTIAVGALLAFLAGGGAARAALAAPGAYGGVVNFYWLLGAVLGVQTIALLIWIIAMLLRAAKPSRGHGWALPVISLGHFLFAAAKWLASRAHQSPTRQAAIEAVIRAQTGPLGRWSFSAISHGLWLAFTIGALVMILMLLTTRQYTFVWETTILSPDAYVRLTEVIAALPRFVGFAAPDAEQIRASQWLGSAEQLPAAAHAAAQAWSSLLVGSIVLYAFGPRLLLLGLSLSMRRSARDAYRIDATQPEYARLRERLMPSAAMIVVREPETASVESVGQPQPPRPVARGSGAPVIIGLEIAPRGAWPPMFPQANWHDLGIVETRDDRRRVLDALRNGELPRAVVVVCDVTATPDRGMERFIREVAATIASPIAVVLTGGQSLRHRGYSADDLAMRIEDWRKACTHSGVVADRTIELDLDHLTTTGMDRLRALVDDSPGGHEPSPRRIEAALDLISSDARQWFITAPDVQAQANLHERIARLYRDEAASWRDHIHAPASLDPSRMAEQLRTSAQRTLELLPARLKSSPKWLAAGALAGAFSCIAAAAIISPAAIAALPAWSGIGAAVAGVLRMYRGGDETEPSREAASGSSEVADAIRAAALFGLLLELQGKRDEAGITRALDRIITDENRPLSSIDEARAWLDDLRHRLDLALAEAES